MKSGFISLIGRTNAGKSSLLNYLLNEKISMVSHKQNATRRKINGIVMHGNDQAIFVDTPGLHESNKTMNKLMIETAIKSIGDCDLILFVTSVFDNLENYKKFLNLKRDVPHIVALTKIDEASDKQIFDKLSQYQKYADEFKAIIPTSTKKQAYKKILMDEICKHLPEHEYFYDPEFITTARGKDIYRDLILEAIFECVSDEIPYSTDVKVDKVVEKQDITEIYATIVTDNKHHKSILIGKDGATIKRIGINSRKIINQLVENKIFLKLNVEVDKNWTSDENAVKKSFEY
ncbi:GTP-binding protein [Campylobacter iguaniorum]|uniref:GTPase Era n=1 Tax=Campylobacter iguaniorum TaxID=1244531 RepID=UPI000739FA9B|nr:GTPase Era [Campylobacter iguaniorum]ALV24482.1 GTP-binding protein [Campylobacter iguaniorum]